MSRTMMVGTSLLAVLAALIWLAMTVMLLEIGGSDAAGRGMAQGVGQIMVIVLWLLLAILLGVAAASGHLPLWTRLALLVLVPASGAAAFVAISLTAGPGGASRAWPLVVPIAAPLVLAAFASWTMLPALRAAVTTPLAGTLLMLLLGALSVAPWPLYRARVAQRAQDNARMADEIDRARDTEHARMRAERQARFAQLGTSSPLSAWMEFLDADSTMRAAALSGIQTVPTRQQEAEALLHQHVWKVLYELPHLSLDATPSICAGANAFLAQAAAKFDTPARAELGKTLEYHQIDRYLPAVQWLADRGCTLEVSGVVAGLRAYPPSPERDAYLRALTR